jgi:hypothetical protein
LGEEEEGGVMGYHERVLKLATAITHARAEITKLKERTKDRERLLNQMERALDGLIKRGIDVAG